MARVSRGGEGERGVALEHVLLGGAEPGDLEEVVHHPEAVEAGVLGALGDVAEGRAERSGPPGQVKYGTCSPAASSPPRLTRDRGG